VQKPQHEITWLDVIRSPAWDSVLLSEVRLIYSRFLLQGIPPECRISVGGSWCSYNRVR